MKLMICSVFIIYFYNYGLLYLLAPMQINLFYSLGPGLAIYPDFNDSWFSDIGYLVFLALFINAMFPPIECFLMGL